MFQRIRRKLFAAVLAFILVVALAGASLACVGARPLAMGGAFTGLADDGNATYWNPAGLVQVDKAAMTFMHTTTNREGINYQDYLAVVTPLSYGSVGFSWIKDNIVIGTQDGWTLDKEDWYWASLAYRIDSRSSIGLNVKQIVNSLPGFTTELGIDFGFFHKVNSKLAMGLLVQDVNEPLMNSSNGPVANWKRNWRPGFSYHPDGKSVASVEVYQALENDRSVRLGYENHLNDKFTLRVGYYGLGNENNSAFTFGVGVVNLGGTLDVAAMAGDLKTVLTSVTMKF